MAGNATADPGGKARAPPPPLSAAKPPAEETDRMEPSDSGLHRFAHEAMYTTFEVIFAGEEEPYARQAAQAVFREIDRLEGLLSRFDPGSDVSQISRLRPGETTRVSLEAFECLRAANRVHAATGGAFDVTVGPLMRCWRTQDGLPRQPSQGEIDAARERIGMDRLVFGRGAVAGEDGFEIGLKAAEGSAAQGIDVDLGGIGKGYALEKAAELLEDWSIEAALLHSGTSTALAIGSGGAAAGCPTGREGWPVGVAGKWREAAGIERIVLRDRALSGSGTEVKGDHIIDCRTGRVARGHLGAWVSCASAAEADALSTAFMVMAPREVEAYCSGWPDVAALLVSEDEDGAEGAVSVQFLSGFDGIGCGGPNS